MKIVTTFKFHFEIEGNKYDFAIDAESLEAAKAILADHFIIMRAEPEA